MTDLLRTLMTERAETAAFAPVDLAVVTRAGERRRHRRTLSVVAGIAVLAVVGGGATVLALDRGRPAEVATTVPDPAGTVPAPGGVSWARGSVLHTPSARLDVGHHVRAYVHTVDGFVFADDGGGVYAVDGTEVRQVGSLGDAEPRLVSDPRGHLAAWVDPTGARPAFVVLDQASGEVTRDDSHTAPTMSSSTGDPALVYAFDGVTLYRRDDRGAVAIDTTTGTTRVVDARATQDYGITGAGHGLVAFGTDHGTEIGTTRDDARPFEQLSNDAKFSPDGRYVTADSDTLDVFATADGSPVDLGLDRGFATGVDWLADGTLLVIAAQKAEDDADAELLTCTVPAGDCETVVASLGTFDELEGDFALPTGVSSD